MAKRKKAAEAEGESYLDYLGIGGDGTIAGGDGKGEGEGEGGGTDEIAGLLKTVDALTSQVETMQKDRRYPAAPVVATVAPTEPKFKEVSLDGLPDQADNPEEWAKGLNSRMTETMRDNMRALSVYTAETEAAATRESGRSNQLWTDFQDTYLSRLEDGLPENMEATPYVEVVARNIATKAVRRGQNLDFYMYQGAFAEDVFAETEKVLAPFRTLEGEGEGEGGKGAGAGADNAFNPGSGDTEVHRTGGIIGPAGTQGSDAAVVDDGKKGSLIDDISEVQRASGFF